MALCMVEGKLYVQLHTQHHHIGHAHRGAVELNLSVLYLKVRFAATKKSSCMCVKHRHKKMAVPRA